MDQTNKAQETVSQVELPLRPTRERRAQEYLNDYELY